MKTYSIERRIIKVKKGWFGSEKVPMWCLVENGVAYDFTNGGNQVYCEPYKYSIVILKSTDKDYIEEELKNFNGENK